MTEIEKKMVDEAYRRFPDDVEPIEDHPLGKIVVDRGNLRFAFIEGARFAGSFDHSEPAGMPHDD